MFCIEHRVKIEEVVELLAAPVEEPPVSDPAPAPEVAAAPQPLARIIALLRPPLPTAPGGVRRPPYKRRRA